MEIAMEIAIILLSICVAIAIYCLAILRGAYRHRPQAQPADDPKTATDVHTRRNSTRRHQRYDLVSVSTLQGGVDTFTQQPPLLGGAESTGGAKNVISLSSIGDIENSDIPNGDVENNDIQNGDAQSGDIQNGAIQNRHVQNGDIQPRPVSRSGNDVGLGPIRAVTKLSAKLTRIRKLKSYQKEVRLAIRYKLRDTGRAEYLRACGQKFRQLDRMNGEVEKLTARIVNALDAAFNSFDNVDSGTMLAFVRADPGRKDPDRSCFCNFLARGKDVEVDRFVKEYMANQ